MNNFVHLHGHSFYSPLDGLCKPESIIDKAVELGHKSIALTDHATLAGIYKFHKYARSKEINPIIGCEFYICDDTKEKNYNYHITLLAKNQEGWKNLLFLQKESYLHFYYKPRIDFNILRLHSNGIVALSGCLKGCIANNLKEEKTDKAIDYLNILKLIFHDDFYIEIMMHNIPIQDKVNQYLREFGEKFNVKTIATNDFHYINKEDAEYQDILLCDQVKSKLTDPNRLKLSTHEFYIKSREEMFNSESELDNTLEVANKCNVEIKNHKQLLPKIENYTDKLILMINDGIEKRKLKVNGELPEEYTKRLREEYDIIIKAKLAPYLLTVADYVQWAKNNDILVGPSRGSGGGCLITYLIGIHDLDPIKYKLLFSRFYNPGRQASLPDIDVDFPLSTAEKVVEYIINKYGNDFVSKIGTYTYLEPKGALKLVCRTMGIDFQTSNNFSKILENPQEIEIEYKNNPIFKDIYDKSKKFLDIAMYSSIHAAGLIISPIELSTFIPVRYNDKQLVSNWDMKDIESIGLIKYDILRLNTLDIIYDVLKQANIKIEDIPIDDKKSFELINTTNNVGVFQLSSSGISKLANDLVVESIEDIGLVVALYRPGPMASDLHNSYVRRKFGEEDIEYPHAKLEQVLKSTLGILIYQEQVTAMCQALAGFTESEADEVRKAMGKKIPELMKKQKTKFLSGCKNNNIENAEELWNLMESFSGYAFCKAHSIGYGLITYYTSYLKAHYPTEFMCSLLNNNFNDMDKISLYLKECKRMDIEVLPPSINGEPNFSIKNNKIIYGMKGIKGIGEKTAINITKKKYIDLNDFFISARPSSDTIVALAEAGAFDEFVPNRNTIISSVEDIVKQLRSAKKMIDTKTIDMFSNISGIRLKSAEELPIKLLSEKEFERLGVYLKYNPLDSRDLSYLTPEDLTNTCIIGGYLRSVDIKITKKKQTMAIGRLLTLLGDLEVIFFPRTYELVKTKIEKNTFVRIKGIQRDKFIAEDIWIL